MIDPLSLNIDTSAASHPVPSGPARKLLKLSPDHPDDYLLEIDYSSFSSFLECPRMAENNLIHARQGTGDETALNFGRLFHLLEEVRLRNGISPAVALRQREIIADFYVKHPCGVMEYRNAATMTSVIDKYNALYAHDGWPDAVLIHEGERFVERPFKVELCTIPVDSRIPYPRELLVAREPGIQDPLDGRWNVPFMDIRNIHLILTGRIDTIISDSNSLWVVDHKTSSRGGREFEHAFHLSLQTRGYSWAARALGIPVSGLIMNAVVVRPPTKTGNGVEFARHTYAYSPDLLDEYERNVIAIMEDFVHCLTRGFFPQSARSFKSPCASCDFEDNCRLPLHQRATDLASACYTNVTWSPIDE